jgi:D-amino-acid oxidase
MLPGKPDVVVVGAGVIGLTTAVVLAEAGFGVSVLARELPADTTSAAAGAIWGPYLVKPRDRVEVWAAESLRIFAGLAEMPGTGVRLAAGVEASRTVSAPPDFLVMLDDVRLCGEAELPDGFVTGWRYTVLGARELAGDSDLHPIRGQLVMMDNPGLTEFFTEDTGWSAGLLHLYPHGDRLVLGGVAQDGSWDMEPDEITARRIVERCAAIDPRVALQPVLAHRVGLRPTRPVIRCEADATITGYRLLHNYGHGGAGVSLSWGCAGEIRRLLDGS